MHAHDVGAPEVEGDQDRDDNGEEANRVGMCYGVEEKWMLAVLGQEGEHVAEQADQVNARCDG